jgi:hypothetical protein
VGFLAPAAFIGGAALLLAILATYLLRPRRPMRRVSSTFLWLAALHDLEAQKPWRRVPPSLLLLLQIAALLAMIGAVARPFLSSTQSTGPYTVVLVDASASMQATDVAPSRFEEARTRARQLIDALEPGQSLALVSLDAQPRVVAPPTSDRGQLHKALASLQPTSQSANFAAALSIAGSLAEGHADAQAVVVADGSIDPSQVPAAFGLPLRYLGVGRVEHARSQRAAQRAGPGRQLQRAADHGQPGPARRWCALRCPRPVPGRQRHRRRRVGQPATERAHPGGSARPAR